MYLMVIECLVVGRWEMEVGIIAYPFFTASKIELDRRSSSEIQTPLNTMVESFSFVLDLFKVNSLLSLILINPSFYIFLIVIVIKNYKRKNVISQEFTHVCTYYFLFCPIILEALPLVLMVLLLLFFSFCTNYLQDISKLKFKLYCIQSFHLSFMLRYIRYFWLWFNLIVTFILFILIFRVFEILEKLGISWESRSWDANPNYTVESLTS
uniref:Uncharacterized protein n=1 Tax=Heterorhabditis bacteriophora TaxID=37862 RepID=A0A1I7WU24_HETBA